MQIVLACLCDHATADNIGKLSIIGVFDSINAEKFPAMHLSMFLVLRIELTFDDNHRSHKLSISLIDEDGRAQGGQMEAQIIPPEIPPGRRMVMNQLIQLDRVLIATPGTYSFKIVADNQPPVLVTFEAQLLGGTA